MKRHLKTETDIPRRIVRLLSATGITVAVAMISLAVWMARSVDELSAEFYQKMVQSELESEIDHLRDLTEHDAHSAAVERWVLHGNTSHPIENTGASSAQTHHLDYTYIYRADDTLLYAVGPDTHEQHGHGLDHAVPPPAISPEILREIRNLTEDPDMISTGFFVINNKVAAVAAARFHLDTDSNDTGNVAQSLSRNAPILVNVVILGEAVFHHMEETLFLQGLTMSTVNPNSRSSIQIPLLGSGEFAYISWTQSRAGMTLLTRSLGVIAAICALTALGHVIVGRITMRLATAYLRESHEARSDRLTGLLNRAGFEETLDSRRVKEAIELNRLALVLLDMDRFKSINDTYGHAAGDLALQNMSLRIQSIVRKNDIAARMGGDEFILLIIDDNPQAIVTLITGRLAEAGRKPIAIADGVEVAVQASMGTAIAKNGISMRELMMAADRAMYDAKTARAFWYDSQDEQTVIGEKRAPSSRSA